MTDPIFIFIVIAIFIIAVALLLSRIYRKTIAQDKQIQKAHERDLDGLSTSVGTGIGIEDGRDD